MAEMVTADANARCGARRRDGSLCPRPPVEGRRRCRSHGCAPRTGAPKGNRNAWKDGLHAAPAIAERRQINAFIRQCLATLREIDEIARGAGESQRPRLVSVSRR